MSGIGLITGRRLALWSVCLVALGICAVSVLGIVRALMHAVRFDAALFLRLAPVLAICAVAMALFQGAKARRSWALWPALALFVAIIPVNAVRVIDRTVNPPIPAAGFANAEDVAKRAGRPLWAIIKPTEAEFRANQRKGLVATLVVLGLVALPTPVLWHLRRRGALQ